MALGGLLLAFPAFGASTAGHAGQNGVLTGKQAEMAAAAWRYFDNNFQPTTCLYNSVDGYPSTTMWDAASSIAAMISARDFDLLPQQTFDKRVPCLLDSLNRMKLFNDEVPNKAYNTITLEPADYTNNPGEIGFSAIDLGRLLTWLAILEERYPTYTDAIDRIVLRWQFGNVVDRSGNLYGAAKGTDGVHYLQEGRLGYEEYGALGFQQWGIGTAEASRVQPYDETRIYGVAIAYDGRDPKVYGAHNYVATEPYLLSGLEFNWDDGDDSSRNDNGHSNPDTAALAKRVYRAQVRRWRATGQLTARSEHQLDVAPWFVYDTVYSDGVPWNTLSDDGQVWPQFAAVSTKAAIGMSVLFPSRYTDLLAERINDLVVSDKGVYEGFYEKDGAPIEALTANTNGILLETLLYAREGKLVREKPAPTKAQP
jgi:hypothetical protein